MEIKSQPIQPSKYRKKKSANSKNCRYLKFEYKNDTKIPRNFPSPNMDVPHKT